jgi:hypothetical protein
VAVFLSNAVVVTINSVNLSDHVTSVSLNRNLDEIETTAMGDGGHKFIKGLEASSITIDFNNDTDTANVLQTLAARWGQITTVTLKQTSAITSPTNPLYTMSCLVNGTQDINGAVGDLGTQSVTWNVVGQIVITTA